MPEITIPLPRKRKPTEEEEVPDLPDFDTMIVPTLDAAGENDSRHSDPKSTIFWNAFTAGSMPYLQAAYDKHVLGKEGDFDDLRRYHQSIVEMAQDSNPSAAEKAALIAPTMMGGMSAIFKAPSTVFGAVGRGAAAGGAHSAVSGFTEDIEPESFGSERFRPAMVQGVIGAAMGGAGGGVTRAATKAPSAIRQRQEQIKAEDAELNKRINDEILNRNRQRRAEKAKQTKLANNEVKQRAQALQELKTPPKVPDPDWRFHKKQFMQDHEYVFDLAAEGYDLAAIANKVNMPKADVVRRMAGRNVTRPDVGFTREVFEESNRVLESYPKEFRVPKDFPQTASSRKPRSTTPPTDPLKQPRPTEQRGPGLKPGKPVTSDQLRSLSAEINKAIKDRGAR